MLMQVDITCLYVVVDETLRIYRFQCSRNTACRFQQLIFREENHFMVLHETRNVTSVHQRGDEVDKFTFLDMLNLLHYILGIGVLS